ncbi:MAG TPA: hypothetical protein VKE22_22375 [Haliangiales bacterium]|nr:hypothetical protein [Haliangiales bacterium]
MAELPKRRLLLRPLLRALHRDVGYLIVGLTLVYAASGLAVNHIGQWDPNFEDFDRVHELGPLPGGDAEVAARVARELGITETPREVYRAAANQLDVLYDHRTLHIDPGSGHVLDEGQRPRLFLRLANWLHLNRGKKAWTYAADAYACLLLFLATSGLFMIKGRKGLWGRGLVLLLVGIAVPVAYVTLSGGP